MISKIFEITEGKNLLINGFSKKLFEEKVIVREDFLDSGEDFGAEDVFKIKFGEEIISLSAEEYICGVVAAEMPALYEAEALKAQAIAAYTYAARERLAAKGREYGS